MSGEERPHPVTIGAAAAFLPAAVFLLFPNGVIQANVDRLLYDPALVRSFALAFVMSTAIIFTLAALLRGWGVIVILFAVGIALFLLISDGTRPYLDAPGVPFAVQLLADAVTAGLVIALVYVFRKHVTGLAGIAAALVVAYVAYDHWAFARQLPAGSVVTANYSADPYAPEASERRDGNVYHIILDAYHGEFFEPNSDLDSFNGFTRYRYFNTNYPRTAVSVPGLLRSHYLEDGDNIASFYDDVAGEALFADLHNAGVRLSLYPFLPRWCVDPQGRCLSMDDMFRSAKGSVFSLTNIDFWFLQLLPHSVRARLNPPGVTTGRQFEGEEESFGFSLTTLFRDDAEKTGALTVDYQIHGLEQFDTLLEEEGRRPATGQYVFWHGMFPHGPRVMDASCEYVGAEAKVDYHAAATCASALAVRLIERLKELGRYDDALIIIQSDHGRPPNADILEISGSETLATLSKELIRQEYLDATNNDDATIYSTDLIDYLSSGLLLVKMPGVTGPLQVSDLPAQGVDAAPTILQHFGLSSEGLDGVPLDRLDEYQDRPNVFIAATRYTTGQRLHAARYELQNGSWVLVRTLAIEE